MRNRYSMGGRRRQWTVLSFLLLSSFRLLGTEDANPKGLKPNVPRIEWNQSTTTLIQSNAYYGRIIRLKDKRWICAFDAEKKIWVRHSNDEGRTWRERVKVADWSHGRLTNAELLQLKNGSLLCFYNERPQEHFGKGDGEINGKGKLPYTVCMVRSQDGGETWMKPETLFKAGTEFTNGCWEPAAIELPSGEIQLFFSNEAPYRESDEQEITLLRSFDAGRTWKEPDTVSFRPHARDGMPVPLILKNGRGIVFSIEDNGLSGLFKPTIVFTTLQDNWRSGVRTPANSNRWGALKDLPAPTVSASAPYLRQMPGGETLLSFQRSDTGELKTAYMVVCIGDENARHFDHSSRPFPNASVPQLWNSLFVKDKRTVIAVTEARINGIFGIWTVEGRFVRK